MEFEKRLERAISRGQQTRTTRQQAETSRELTDEQLRGEHARCRLDLSEQIEAGLQKLADYFPGFRFETVVSEEGWGARISRDDIALGSRRGPGGAAAGSGGAGGGGAGAGAGAAGTEYSRLEILVRPFSTAHILELVGKGTIRNKELFHRNHFQFLTQVDLQSVRDLVDLWVLEYAETYAARS